MNNQFYVSFYTAGIVLKLSADFSIAWSIKYGTTPSGLAVNEADDFLVVGFSVVVGTNGHLAKINTSNGDIIDVYTSGSAFDYIVYMQIKHGLIS